MYHNILAYCIPEKYPVTSLFSKVFKSLFLQLCEYLDIKFNNNNKKMYAIKNIESVIQINHVLFQKINKLYYNRYKWLNKVDLTQRNPKSCTVDGAIGVALLNLLMQFDPKYYFGFYFTFN